MYSLDPLPANESYSPFNICFCSLMFMIFRNDLIAFIVATMDLSTFLLIHAVTVSAYTEQKLDTWDIRNIE